MELEEWWAACRLDAPSEIEGTTLRGGLIVYKSRRDNTERQPMEPGLALMWCGGCVLWLCEACGTNDTDFSITLLEMFTSQTTYL